MCGAQAVIFGLFGVAPQFDDSLAASPHLPPFAQRMALRGLKLRGKTMDIEVEGSQFLMKSDGAIQKGDIGQAVTVR